MTDDYILVAAIDFGTTYSGYAFSTKSEFQADPLMIHSNQAWVSGGKYLLSLKTPTCLLLDKNGKFVSFGFDAENKYADLVLDEKQEDYMYFSRFKMKLHNNKDLTKNTTIEDISGKKFSAMKVFALSIQALKSHLLETLDTQGLTIKPQEIKWVLTVPAIWSDTAKQFMREAAKTAGIPDKMLKIALEPEAASIFCQHLPVERLYGAAKGFSVSQKGAKYMVIDLGGGTADITVHEKIDGNKLKELFKASGGACGGTAVDHQFFQSLVAIFAGPFIHSLRTQKTSAYVDLCREFETVKRTVKSNATGRVNITVPYVAMNELCKEVHEDEIDSILKESVLSDEIKCMGDKFRIDAAHLKKLFKQTIDEIIQHIKDIMTKSEAKGVSRFLLVGGFSECHLIQEAIRKEFPKIKIIIPEEAGLSVLKGAVIFGHMPDTISSRIMRFTYGVRITPEFDYSKHCQSKLFQMNGVEHCADIFAPFMKAGTEVPINHTVVEAYSTTRPYQDSMPVVIYCSEKDTPTYVTDNGCRKLGVLDVKIPNPSAMDHSLAVQFEFGDTELHIIAIEMESKSPCTAKFNLI